MNVTLETHTLSRKVIISKFSSYYNFYIRALSIVTVEWTLFCVRYKPKAGLIAVIMELSYPALSLPLFEREFWSTPESYCMTLPTSCRCCNSSVVSILSDYTSFRLKHCAWDCECEKSAHGQHSAFYSFMSCQMKQIIWSNSRSIRYTELFSMMWHSFSPVTIHLQHSYSCLLL